jgi:hypothetical protein
MLAGLVEQEGYHFRLMHHRLRRTLRLSQECHLLSLTSFQRVVLYHKTQDQEPSAERKTSEPDNEPGDDRRHLLTSPVILAQEGVVEGLVTGRVPTLSWVIERVHGGPKDWSPSSSIETT